MTSTPAVRVRNLRKVYPATSTGAPPTVAVDDVSLTVAQGEIFGILGPNGAGKTTTVECLAGLRPIDGGTVEVLGLDPHRDGPRVRHVLGVQLQQSELQDKITVAEALDLYASFYPAPAPRDELLAMLDLTDKRTTQFRNLSGGQRQRLSIALALVGNPRVAILDELTTGLDPQARRDTWDLVERVRDSGVTIVLVTHFMDEAERLCDRLVVVDEGRVVAEGSPRELVEALDTERTVRLRLPRPVPLDLLGALPDVRSVRALGPAPGGGGQAPRVGTPPTEALELEVRGTSRVLPVVVLALWEHDVVPDDVRTVSRTLEDVFVAVTGKGKSHVGAAQD